MPRYYVVNESTDDTLETADTLQDAVRLARQAAKRGTAGDLVSVLESDGKSVGQFALLPDGAVKEQPIVFPGKPIDASHS